MRGKLFILSGQSGVGKNTILKAILTKHPEFHRAVTFTTRDQRPEEIAGEDHYFVYQEKFDEMIKKGEFLEYAKVHNDMYGTPKEQIENALKSGKNVLMEIDVQGATQVKKMMPEATLIFIKYDGDNIESAIRNRLAHDNSRGETSEADIAKRIESAKKETAYEKDYDFSVVNPEGSPDLAINEVEEIINKEIK